ncbi:T9SS type A sorting domain-containing protein [Candidatus Marinimicrobia bacterium]|nr:T9SS type A sorting domain-containing protein [Candidatus Neomarinimicrobiota bacterium]
MKKIIILTILPLFFGFLKADAIEVSPSTLDFGNVLMGNSPTMTFTLDMNLEQTITITAPNYFTVDVTEIQATDGLTQDIVVTFSPPSVGTYDSYVTLTGSVFGSAAVAVNATAVNNIEGSLSGTITSEFSPYEVSGDILVEAGDTLIINPGVTLEFTGYNKFTVYGVLKVNGDPDSLVHFNASENNEYGWKGIHIEESDSTLIQYAMIEDVGYTLLEDNETGSANDVWEAGSHGSGFYKQFNFSSDAYNGDSSLYIFNSSAMNVDYNLNSAKLREYLPEIPPNTKISFWSKRSGLEYNSTSSFQVYVQNRNVWYGYNSQTSEDFDGCGENVWCYSEFNISHAFEWYAINQNSSAEIEIIIYGGTSARIRIDDFKVEYGSEAALNIKESNLRIMNTGITRNKSHGLKINESDIVLNHSILYQNEGIGFISHSSFPLVSNSIIFQNSSAGVNQANGSVTQMYSTIGGGTNCGVCSEEGYYNFEDCESAVSSSTSSQELFWTTIDCNISTYEVNQYSPLLNYDLTLDQYSPLIDAGNPLQSDACLPPGLGGIVSDIGMYGGENNCGASGSNMPDGLPIIDNVQDLPQDQGGFVGIQYQGSVYDHEHEGYNITHYYFWREMDINQREESSNSLTFNEIYDINSRDMDYWEFIGEMTAEGFESYGYSAPTLADSTASDGIFWSKYLVVAHTDNDDVFFVSEPDSGYSVDNIAPYAPQNIQVQTGEYGATLSWEVVEENIDIAFYEVYKDDVLHSQITETIFVDSVGYGSSSIFTIRGVDENGNVGEFSDPLEVSTGTLGDVTWDGTIDVLDVLNIADIIMSGVSGFTEGELWASDLNVDGSTDVFDLMQLVDHIMGGASASRTGSNNTPTAIYTEAGSLYLSSSNPVQGLELVLSDYLEEVSNKTDLIFHHVGNKILIYSMGDKVLSGEKIELFTLPEGVHIISAKVSGPAGERYETTLGVIPKAFTVHQNYPNPFNPSTSIQIDVPEISMVKVMVFDATGREIQTIMNAEFYPGYHTLTWNGSDQSGRQVASGIYFIQVTTQDYSKTIKSMLLR